MKKIYKYPLNLVEHQFISLPVGAKPLAVKMQREDVCLWALIDAENEMETKSVYIFGTGNPIEEDLTDATYLGTVLMAQDAFVWHVFIK